MKKRTTKRVPRTRSIGTTLLIMFLSGLVYKSGEALFTKVVEPRINDLLAPDSRD